MLHRKHTLISAGTTAKSSRLTWAVFVLITIALVYNFYLMMRSDAEWSRPRVTHPGQYIGSSIQRPHIPLPAVPVLVDAPPPVGATTASPSPSTRKETHATLLSCMETTHQQQLGGAALLCRRHLQHLAALVMGLMKTNLTTELLDDLTACATNASAPSVCVAALRRVAPEKRADLRLSALRIAEDHWNAARSGTLQPRSKHLRTVVQKYPPYLWHNIISWSPHVTAAAFGEESVENERKKWRHGRREPGVHPLLSDPIIPRQQKQEVCEERLPGAWFAPYSDTIRVLFEGELALREMLQSPNQSAGFTPLSSFHTVWAFPQPRKCALEAFARLGISRHPIITTNSVEGFPGGVWQGYIDNTTGITEAIAALRSIVQLGSSGGSNSSAWVDFIWIDLPQKSPALARHLVRALSTYNPWMALNSFTSCAHILSGLGDVPVLDLTGDESVAGRVLVPAPLQPYNMLGISDCSTHPLNPAGEECHLSSTVAANFDRLFSVVKNESNDGSLGRRLVGILPRLLCLHVLGIDGRKSTSGDAVDEVFVEYHRTAADYARVGAGGCTKTILIIALTVTEEQLNQATQYKTTHPRQGSAALRSECAVADAFLRMHGIDVVLDFPLLDATTDMHVIIDSSDKIHSDDRAWYYAMRNIILTGVETKEMHQHRFVFAESFRYADGVPRHGPKPYYDVIAIIPNSVTFIATSAYRFFTRRDVTASTHVMHVPRLYAHPSAARPTTFPASSAHRFMLIDAQMYVLLFSVLGTAECRLRETDPVFDTWRCIRKLGLKITNPTEEKRSLILPAAEGRESSPFAFAIVDEKTTLASVLRWTKTN